MGLGLNLKAKQSLMQEAINFALQAKGYTAPNPCVGALLVKDGKILAKGAHLIYGGAHAEVNVLKQAERLGIDSAKTSMFVTLEPCNHFGRTPPCTKAIISAGIKHVVIGTRDPNPEVQGNGLNFLQDNGVKVEIGIAEQFCQDLIADFKVWQLQKRPYVQLKLASTVDGKIASRTGHSAWISGEESRSLVHDLRSRVQAIAVGGNTFYADNPRLTFRGIGEKKHTQPLALVITSRLPEADQCFYLISERAQDLIFFTSEIAATSDRAKFLQDKGIRVWGLPGKQGNLDLLYGLKKLFTELNCYYVLCEGGGNLGMRLIESNLADELLLFIAPKVLGDAQAVNLFSGREVQDMDQAYNLRFAGFKQVGNDLLLQIIQNNFGLD